MIKAILLAAGQSKRLKSENKLIKKFKNKALINHSLQALFKSKVDKIIIVLGYQNKEVRKIIKKNKKNIFVLTYLFGPCATGVYIMPAAYSNVKAVYTNTAPVDAYRGAGRPEATYTIERLVVKYSEQLA